MKKKELANPLVLRLCLDHGQTVIGEIFVVRDDFHKCSRFPSLTFVDSAQTSTRIAKPR
jgi:hypothetical protein